MSSDTKPTILISGREARRRCGNPHRVTWCRWLHRPDMGLPEPREINGKHYFVEAEVDRWIASRIKVAA